MLSLTVDWGALDTTVDAWVTHAADPLDPAVRQGLGGMVAATWEATGGGLVLPGMTRAVHQPQVPVHVQADGDGVTVAIPEAVADQVEGGEAAWDMKPGLLHGPKSRVGRQGRYNRIPLRHQAASIPSGAALAAVMGQRFIDTVRQTSHNAPWLVTNALAGYTWKTGRYTGLMATTAGPITIRTVSARSPAASWWYPARAGTPWADPVWRYVERAVTDAWITAWEVNTFGPARGGSGAPAGD